MTANDWTWRPARLDDIDVIHDIQSVVHADHCEAYDVLIERLRLCPRGCFVLEHGNAISGYVLSHPWIRRSPPPIDTLLGAVPHTADVWYLHDLALMPETRGSGAGSSVSALLAAQARRAGYDAATLISINGSQGFWERQGFSVHAEPGLADKLATYGGQAVYMEKNLLADRLPLSA